MEAVNNRHFDVAVIGSGFAGSIMAMVLRRMGRSVLLLERGSHPRFAIGESSTPFANLLLETIAERFDLPFLKQLSEWGSWQRAHPELAAGLKRGFTFYGHKPGAVLDLSDRESQFLVSASPNDEVADTHWYRPDFDAFLVEQAKELGVKYVDRFQAEAPALSGSWRLGSDFTADFAIDASGRNSVMAEAAKIPLRAADPMPPTRSVFAHFRDVPRLPCPAGPPYPPENAAVHHILEEGWMWVLRFNNGVTSAGLALNGGSLGWPEILRKYPALAAQFQIAKPITEFYSIEPLSFRRARAVGKKFALLPSAAGFVDPLLSTGFALSLLGILRLSDVLHGSGTLAQYEAETFRELDATADLVSALYSKLHSFPEFCRLTLLYFAALSFTETCWRLGHAERAASFLLVHNPLFDSARASICSAARNGAYIDQAAIQKAIAPFDIAGLAQFERRGWYPMDVNALMRNRHKLGASREQIETLYRSLRILSPSAALQP